jgi:predicted SprT family Zn-dependent metalloprotease
LHNSFSYGKIEKTEEQNMKDLQQTLTLQRQLQDMFNDLRVKFPSVRAYNLQWDNGVRRLGYCNPYYKIVSISMNHIRGSADSEVVDTLLHEVAHAVAEERAKVRGVRIKSHGFEWRSACLEVGARPERVKHTAYTIDRPQSKYTLTCNTCGHTSGIARWNGHRRYSCSKCGIKNGIKGFNPNYLMTITKN